MTEIFLSDITRYDNRINKLKEGMSDTILDHCEKYQNEKDLQASLLGWNILTMILANRKVDISKIDLTYNEFGKPYLGNNWFSISHSGQIVAVCVSTSEVGIDIQKIDSNRNIDLLKNRYFSEKEINILDNSDDKAKCFTEIWTRKEAFHKHVGDGIQLDKFKRDLPYDEICTIYLEDKDKNGYILSADCIDNEKVYIKVI